MAKSDEELKDVERQWNVFQETFVAPEALSEEELKKVVVQDLSVVSKMSVEEYTLYQKWMEIHNKYPVEYKPLFDEYHLIDGNQKFLIDEIKNNIWIPEHPDDFIKLEPRLVYANGDLAETWNTIRTFTSTMKNNNNIGRNLNYIVVDEVTGKYLGVICISSDFLDLTPRDKYIGWSRTKKTDEGMINHTAIGSTIVPLQPLGYNYTGGKLLALLCLCDEVQNKWKELYGDKLVGVTTTSLYGKSKTNTLSQYDRLQHWKKMGFTSGSVSYETTRSTTSEIIKWLKKNHTRKYFEWFVAKKLTGQQIGRAHV